MAKTNLLNQKREYLFAGAILLLTSFSLIYFLSHLITIKKDSSTAVYGIDLIAYYTAAQLIAVGEISEIYAEVGEDYSVVNNGRFFETAKEAGFKLTPTRYVYLPIFLAFFQPLTRFSFSFVADLWLIVNMIIVIAIILLQLHFTRAIGKPFLRVMVITALNLFSFPLFYALKLGQTTLIIYLIICLIYYFTLKGRDIIAGVFLAVIVTLKYSPLIFVLYFLYKKSYTLVISCLTTAVILIILSTIIYGLPVHKMYWHYLTNLSGLEIAGWSNQSLSGFLLRQFTGSEVLSFTPVKITGWLPLLRNAVALILIMIICLVFKAKDCRKYQLRYSLEFSATILCFSILPPISWLHYFVLAILPTIIIITVSLKADGQTAKSVLLLLTTIGYCMIAYHPDYFRLFAILGRNFFSNLLVSIPFLGACLLLGINLWLIKRSHLVQLNHCSPDKGN